MVKRKAAVQAPQVETRSKRKPNMSADTNGTTFNSEVAAKKIIQKEGKPSTPSQTSKDDMQLVLQSFRLLIADLCQQFGMGTPIQFEVTTVLMLNCIQDIQAARWEWRQLV
jgi:hypothetical protein